ncbi:FAD-dependent oxidoreductase [Streptomyces sp. NPDC087917]|uniref:FAD-dependent oxidoreductase n=1 Tax=Streptomyces sp. NPDC087917 TaxID=3155060 RepID=UPI003448B4E6
MANADGGGELGYDTLLYALGSHGADNGVPGVAQDAFDVAARPSALRLRERLDSLSKRDEGRSVLVVGDGLTGIETATEIAESRPGLSVTLVARGELGAPLSAGARSHLRQTCDRLGITVLEHTSVEAVEATRVLCAEGTALASDATVWTAGFAVSPMVPLAEAWDSGASSWTAQRREAYANDLGQEASLVAVTARSNRQKSDQDPAEWLPSSSEALCRYASEWTATKLRWQLSVDELEKDTLLNIAAGCGGNTVTYTPAP